MSPEEEPEEELEEEPEDIDGRASATLIASGSLRGPYLGRVPLGPELTREVLITYDKSKYDFATLMWEVMMSDGPDRSLETAVVAEASQLLGSIHTLELHKRGRQAAHRIVSGRSLYNRRWRIDTPARRKLLALLRLFVREVIVPHTEARLAADLSTARDAARFCGDPAAAGVLDSLPAVLPLRRLMIQREPTFRVHLPGTRKALGTRHIDAEYFHQRGEINYWLPLTRCFGSNTLWTESVPGAKDFHPLELDFGQLACFYGNQCEHYTLPNDTDTTRISLDFRIVADAHFEAVPAGIPLRPRTGKPYFNVGEWYDVVELDESR